MISTHCSIIETQKLTKWLLCQPWAGPDHAQDLAHEAYLAALERQRNGLKPRWLTSLAQDAARSPGYRLLHANTLLRNAKTGEKESAKTPARSEVELQIDLATLMIAAPPGPYLQDDMLDALAMVQRIGSGDLKQAVDSILVGSDMDEAAAEAGMTAVQLYRALRLVGRKLTGRGRGKGNKRDPQQMDLFGCQTEEVL